jgi:electron transfer flavoprotein-quinone oxidoreductase
MAKGGLNVLQFERGKYPGAKNMWGGAFFGPQLCALFPGWLEEAPIERVVTRQVLGFLTEKGSVSLDFSSSRFAVPPYNGFILLRAKFDNWMSKKVEQAGVIVASGMMVDDLLMKENKVAGVKVGKEEFPCDVVVLAEGVNGILAQRAGLRKELAPGDMKQGVKEVIELPRAALEDRFRLRGNEGAALEFVGTCTRGLPGGGFVYTNKESLSVGVVVDLAALVKERLKASDLLESFKGHPEIRKLIEGGETVEYSAHLIPASGINMMPKLYTDGLLVTGDAACLLLGTGLILEGANFAVASGIAAAETVRAAREKGDFSANTLSSYAAALKETFVLQELETFRAAPFFLKNPRIYGAYPETLVETFEELFKNDGKPRKKTFGSVLEIVRKRIGLKQLVLDGWRMRKSI